MADASKLCLTIAKCEVAQDVRTKVSTALGKEALSCAPLVTSQLLELQVSREDQPVPGETWHFPEPWNGHLASAPLLFIGQNPSLGLDEPYPGSGLDDPWPDAKVIEFFNNRFGSGHLQIEDGCRVPRLNGERWTKSSPSRFLSHIHEQATELYGSSVEPGSAYAVTEAARCKAARAVGVERAAKVCSTLYLEKVLCVSAATVVVCVGKVAREAFATTFGVESATTKVHQLAGRPRLVIFVRHSGAWGGRTQIKQGDIALARKMLPSTTGERRGSTQR